ncbi:MAG: WYL domain-containing protein [Deltaproteobacteria bacterium]|nr:WYL domain-containing protein [Deltaproteobacteria bacterium]
MPSDTRTATWSRRLGILHALLHRGHITTVQAARHASCNRRLALSDLEALCAHGVPIHKEGEGRDTRWVVDDGWRQAGLGLDLPTRLALLFGRELVSGIMHETRFARAFETFEGALARLNPALDGIHKDLSRRFHVVHEADKDYGKHQETLETLVTAILGNHRVAIDYEKPDGGHRSYKAAAPYSLLLYKRTVYLVCESHGATRTLAIERIRAVTPLPDATFDYPRPSEYSPEKLLEGTFGIHRGGESPAPVRLRFDAKVAPLVSTRRWHPTQTLTALPDGGCELHFTATGRELIPFTLGWGPNVEVLEPAWLRDAVHAELREALARYE